MNLQATKTKAESLKKTFSADRSLVDIVRKGSLTSLKRSSLVKKLHHASSPYSQPLQSAEKPQIRTRDTKPAITDSNLSTIEERMSKRQRLPRNQSFTETLSDNSYGSHSPGLLLRKKSPVEEVSDNALTLNKALNDKLKACGGEYDVRERFLAFQATFAAVISMDTNFGVVLKRIKTGYDEYFNHCNSMEKAQENEKFSKQLIEFQDILEQEQSEKETLLNTIVQLRQDKTALTSKLLEKTSRIKSLEKTIGDLSTTAKVSTSKDSDDKSDLEKATLQDMIANLQDEVALLRNREQLLLSVLKSAKHQGFPIDEIFKMHTRHRKATTSMAAESRATIIPRLNLAAMSNLGQLSPITTNEEGDESKSEFRDSLTSFAKEIDLSRVSGGERTAGSQ